MPTPRNIVVINAFSKMGNFRAKSPVNGSSLGAMKIGYRYAPQAIDIIPIPNPVSSVRNGARSLLNVELGESDCSSTAVLFQK
jgi:hypothetical protein